MPSGLPYWVRNSRAIASEDWLSKALENQGLTQGQYEGILLAATTCEPVRVKKKLVYGIEEIEVAIGDRPK